MKDQRPGEDYMTYLRLRRVYQQGRAGLERRHRAFAVRMVRELLAAFDSFVSGENTFNSFGVVRAARRWLAKMEGE